LVFDEPETLTYQRMDGELTATTAEDPTTYVWTGGSTIAR
jgi:hypothetical protein